MSPTRPEWFREGKSTEEKRERRSAAAELPSPPDLDEALAALTLLETQALEGAAKVRQALAAIRDSEIKGIREEEARSRPPKPDRDR